MAAETAKPNFLKIGILGAREALKDFLSQTHFLLDKPLEIWQNLVCTEIVKKSAVILLITMKKLQILDDKNRAISEDSVDIIDIYLSNINGVIFAFFGEW